VIAASRGDVLIRVPPQDRLAYRSGDPDARAPAGPGGFLSVEDPVGVDRGIEALVQAAQVVALRTPAASSRIASATWRCSAVALVVTSSTVTRSPWPARRRSHPPRARRRCRVARPERYRQLRLLRGGWGEVRSDPGGRPGCWTPPPRRGSRGSPAPHSPTRATAPARPSDDDAASDPPPRHQRVARAGVEALRTPSATPGREGGDRSSLPDMTTRYGTGSDSSGPDRNLWNLSVTSSDVPSADRIHGRGSVCRVRLSCGDPGRLRRSAPLRARSAKTSRPAPLTTVS